jgi:hypothetical protein
MPVIKFVAVPLMWNPAGAVEVDVVPLVVVAVVVSPLPTTPQPIRLREVASAMIAFVRILGSK